MVNLLASEWIRCGVCVGCACGMWGMFGECVGCAYGVRGVCLGCVRGVCVLTLRLVATRSRGEKESGPGVRDRHDQGQQEVSGFRAPHGNGEFHPSPLTFLPFSPSSPSPSLPLSPSPPVAATSTLISPIPPSPLVAARRLPGRLQAGWGRPHTHRRIHERSTAKRSRAALPGERRRQGGRAGDHCRGDRPHPDSGVDRGVR